MARKASNTKLHKAKESKSDEFYTQYCDIERELLHYSDYFNDKIVYCNCDIPSKSNFVKYFIDNFKKLGLKKLVASYYVRSSTDLFNGNRSEAGGYIEYCGEPLKSIDDIKIKKFNGDGDFRKEECLCILKAVDVVVTNPPFSLFRDYISLITKYNKKFLVISNINAITYKEIFSLIQSNRIWLGHNLGRGISGFIVPDNYELFGSETHIDSDGNRIISTNNCLWLTNLPTTLRNEFLPLTKKYQGHEDLYPTFDNYDGINVNRTQDIPMDYSGVMGVPITFLHKYNPQQFEIIKFRKGDDNKDLSVNGKCPYFRILVRNIDKNKRQSTEDNKPMKCTDVKSKKVSTCRQLSLFDA